MSFEHSERLAGLIVVAALVAAYVWLQQRNKSAAVVFADADLLDELVVNIPAPWRQHIGFAGLCVATALLIAAGANPQTIQERASEQAQIVLAMDVSVSMDATDVAPSRLDAATVAAQEFVRQAPTGTRIGLVAFAGTAEPVAAPTSDKTLLNDALVQLNTGLGTAIGEAVFSSLGLLDTAGFAPAPGSELGVVQREGAILLLSDGTSNSGRPVTDAIAAAAASGVEIFTVAFGTSAGVITDPAGNTQAVPADYEQLASIAAGTNGKAYTAETSAELVTVFSSVAESISTEELPTSVAPEVALVAALLFVLFGAASLWFSSRLV